MTDTKCSSIIYIVQIACACIWCLLSSGIIFGFAAFKPILISEGIYSELCSNNEFSKRGITNMEPCTLQDLQLNNIFTVAAVVTNVIALPVGWLLDYCGPQVSGVIGALSISMGAFSFIFSDVLISVLDPYLTGFILLAAGGPFVFISCFHLANTFSNSSGTVMALITGTFDSSSALFLIYRKVYQKMEGTLNLKTFFTFYLVVPIFIIFCQFFIMPRYSYQSPVTREGLSLNSDNISPEPAILEAEDALIGDQTILTLKRRNTYSTIETMAESRIHRHIGRTFDSMHGYSIRKQILSPWFYLMLLFAAICMLRINYFVATIRSQEEFLIGDIQLALKLNSYFDLLLPVGGIIAIPFIGLVLDKMESLHIIMLLSTFSVSIGLFGLVPNSFTLNMIGIVLLVVYRPFYYTVVSAYTSKIFGFETFGTVYGLLTCLCGICNLFQNYLDKLTHTKFHMDPTPVNIILVISTLISASALVVYIHSKRNQFNRKVSSSSGPLIIERNITNNYDSI